VSSWRRPHAVPRRFSCVGRAARGKKWQRGAFTGIFFEFVNPPVGSSTELTLMTNDGTGVTELTTDHEVCADNQWSADGTRIVFRESSPDPTTPTRIRMVTFDDCQ